MKKLIIFLISYIMMLGIYSKEIPYTLEDRERLIRLEEGIKFVNQRIDDVKEEIRDLKTFMLWGFGILFSGMGILMGFVLWDRRTAISPVIKRTKELEGIVRGGFLVRGRCGSVEYNRFFLINYLKFPILPIRLKYGK